MILLFALVIICGVAVNAVTADEFVFRFDMGTPVSPLKEGFVRVTPDDLYFPARGYGWSARPVSAFDRSRSRCKAEWYQDFWPDEVVGEEPYYGEPVDDLWRDGVAAGEDLDFRVDLPNGMYDVYVTVGDEEWTRLDMHVAAEDSVFHEEIRTWIFWGANAAHRRLRLRVAVEDGALDIRFFNSGRDIPLTMDTVETLHQVVNSVLGVEIALYHPPPLSLAGGELWVVEELDSPELHAGFEPYRQGRFDSALAAWEEIAGPRSELLKGILWSWVAGVPAREDEVVLLDRAVAHLENAVQKSPQDPTPAQVLARIAGLRDGLLIYRGEKSREFREPNAWVYRKRYADSGKDVLLQVAPDEPFYYKARLEIGKRMYWDLRESPGHPVYHGYREFVDETMRSILAAYPGFATARIYLDQKVRWGPDYAEDAAGAPRWAGLAREVLSRQHAVIRWWTDHQAADGSMGGDQSFNDDVEMLRNWVGVALAADDPAIGESIGRIADGVYTHVAPRGYSQGIWDVQHSAEPTGDPAVLTRIDYGNPAPVERGFALLALCRDLFTGIDGRGYRRFKSIMMGADGVIEEPPFACDTHYHVRAAKPGLWAMWYSGLPEAVALFGEWADAWHEAAMRTDRGKPRGVMPSAVAFPSGRIGGYGPEDDWRKTDSGYAYYDWNPGIARPYALLYVMWRATGRDRYMEPTFAAPMPAVALAWRGYTGDGSRDELIGSAGGAYGRFLLSGDIAAIEEALSGTLDHLRYNFSLKTSEVTMTDRIDIGDTGTIHGMFTGAVAVNGLPYTLGAISWEGAGTDFAALVRGHSPADMRFNVYSFHGEEREVGVRFWDLERGEYDIRIGADADDDGFVDVDARSATFTMDKRGDTFRFVLPPGELLAVEVAQRRKSPPLQGPLPDIAFTDRDVELALSAAGEVSVEVRLHNIGGERTGPFTVALAERGIDGTLRPIASAPVPELEAAHDFVPRTVTVALAGSTSKHVAALVITADPDDQVDEIYEGNNQVAVSVAP